MGRFIKTVTGRLIAANAALFVVFLVLVKFVAGPGFADYVGVDGARPWPWTFLTYMFVHDSLLDLLFNMLWLWLFARIVMEFSTPRQLLLCYVLGGLGGGLLFWGAAAAGLTGGVLLGASAAVLALIAYAGVRIPYLKLNLMLIGAVSVRAIALIAAVLSLLPFLLGNGGGGWAHLGGLLAGVGYALYMRRARRFRIVRPSEKKTLDDLLDKVRRSGYSSLTKDERRQLLEYSKSL